MAYSGGECLMHSVRVSQELCFTRGTLTGASHPELYRQLPQAVQELGPTHPLRPGWHGGHDVSGHAFILVLGVLLIGESLIPYLPYVLPSFSYLRESIPRGLYADRNVFQLPTCARRVNMAVMALSLALLGLWLGMLLMTSVYFHDPLEKATGFGAAVAVWALMPKETVLS